MIYTTYIDKGGRAANEDSILVEARGGAYLFAVADGLGGEGGGDIASRMVVETLKSEFSKPNFLLEQAVLTANNAVLEKQRFTRRKMKSTCAAVLINQMQTVTANVGDSRIYLFENGEIVFQSRDHSAAQIAADLGKITREEIRKYAERNVVTRALGVDDELKVDISIIENSAYDSILICSDGLWEYVSEREMEAALCKKPQIFLDKLRKIHKKRAPANCDNNSAVVACCE